MKTEKAAVSGTGGKSGGYRIRVVLPERSRSEGDGGDQRQEAEARCDAGTGLQGDNAGGGG